MSENIKRVLRERASLDEKRDAEKRRVREALAEQERLDEASGYNSAVDDLFGQIERAAPYIDASSDKKRWLPSTMLKIAFLASSDSGNKGARMRAFAFVDRMLAVARRRWLDGVDPNPWLSKSEDLRGGRSWL